MDSEKDNQGVPTPPENSGSQGPPSAPEPGGEPGPSEEKTTPAETPEPEGGELPATTPEQDPYYDEAYDYSYDAPEASDEGGYDQVVAPPPSPPARVAPPPPPKPPPPPPPEEDEEDEEEEGMLRMSFLDHLEELRKRLLHALMGIAAAFGIGVYFNDSLWDIIQQPFHEAMIANGQDPSLVMLTPSEGFSIIWVKVPVLAAIFLSSPWLVYQVWAFISPGLYRKERRWAVPFIFSTAGLFILGGLFSYFVAFRLGLTFLLGIGVARSVKPVVSITEYFDLFVNVSLGMGLVFELPVLIFFLSLLRLVTPQFLIRNSRYAILIITIIAAIITPTPDVVNLMLITVPMTALYFSGVLASYLLWRSRENRGIPWMLFLFVAALILAFAGGLWYAVDHLGYHWVRTWPFLVK